MSHSLCSLVVACEAAQEAELGGLLGDAEEDTAPARHRYLRAAPPPLDAPGGAARNLWTAHVPEDYRWAALIDRALNRMEYELTVRAATGGALGAKDTNDDSEDSYRSAAGWNGETGGVAGREITKYFCEH
jgi:hypothetical protein